MPMRNLLLFILLGVTLPGLAAPIVIAHRGASGYLPEHTLAAYERAIDMGADYIEPDLVITRDGHLVARHEHYLSVTTDVAERPEFANRKRKLDDREDWFSEDFTLAELRTLRTRQAFPGRSPAYDGKFPIPTLEEVINLVQRKEVETGRIIGLYPETKSPGHFTRLGFDFPALLLGVLKAHGLDQADSAVFIQSFEPQILRRLNEMTELKLVMLVQPVSREAVNTPNIPLEEIREFADGVGPFKALLFRPDGSQSGFVAEAHALGLLVHPWTFRDDAVPPATYASPEAEIRAYLTLGIDGFFTDFADTGVRVRDEWVIAR
ncbi:MAG: glycerophosphodiester phosphodiesterase family protein [Pseudomonadota bacterium]